MACGSYFGDWDNKNNFLRAPLAKGDALTNVWAGIPAWYFHHMGLGDNIGYSSLVTMNNTGLYAPVTEGWQGSIGKAHLGLMGDPSLRMEMVAPPTGLTVTNSGGTAAFNWTASSGSVVGYHIYRFSSNGSITRLTTDPVVGTSYQHASIPFEPGREYMVRAVKLQVNQSGSYFNLSLGSIATAAGGNVATDCQGVAGGSATVGSPCNDSNPCTVNDTWNANCQCVGTPVSVSATITAAGATSFCSGGSVVLNANTGSGLTYVWRRDGSTISGATSSSYTATQAGVYTVRVSSGGCESTSSGVTVQVNNAPTATITAAGATSFCSGGSVSLSANTGSGFTYAWSRNGVLLSGATGSTITATVSGSYTVTVTSTGCSTTSQAVQVSVDNGPATSIQADGPTALCAGGHVTLQAVQGSGVSYSWMVNGAAIPGATSSSLLVDEAGAYSVVATANGCTAVSEVVQVTVLDLLPPVVNATEDGVMCAGASIELSTAEVSGATYLWSFNGNPIVGQQGPSLTVDEGGVYGLQIASGSCSSATVFSTVQVLALPIIECFADVVDASVGVEVLDGVGPFVYKWNGDDSLAAPEMAVGTSGSYEVAVTDANGCTDTCMVDIMLDEDGNGCIGMRTMAQGSWGGYEPLDSLFTVAFPEGLTIGCGFRMLTLTAASAVLDFLPSQGPSLRLPIGDLLDPGTSYGNSLAGELVSLKLAARMDEIDPEFSVETVMLKDAVIATGTFQGWTVQQLLDEADLKIGGCFSWFSRMQLRNALAAINTGYHQGIVANGMLECPEVEELNEGVLPQALMLRTQDDEQRGSVNTSAFPNPFMGTTTIRISELPAAERITIEILSVEGVVLETLFSGMVQEGVETRVDWHAGSRARGVYFYRVLGGELLLQGRLVVQ
jgi:hypothetical protein